MELLLNYCLKKCLVQVCLALVLMLEALQISLGANLGSAESIQKSLYFQVSLLFLAFAIELWKLSYVLGRDNSFYWLV